MFGEGVGEGVFVVFDGVVVGEVGLYELGDEIGFVVVDG